MFTDGEMEFRVSWRKDGRKGFEETDGKRRRRQTANASAQAQAERWGCSLGSTLSLFCLLAALLVPSQHHRSNQHRRSIAAAEMNLEVSRKPQRLLGYVQPADGYLAPREIRDLTTSASSDSHGALRDFWMGAVYAAAGGKE